MSMSGNFSGPGPYNVFIPPVSGARKNRFMLVGDSLANHNFFENVSGTVYDVRNMSRALHIIDGLLGGRLNIVNNGGVSGQRTDEILARWDNDVLGVGFYGGIGSTGGPYGTVLPGVSPFRPDLIGVIAGANDILQGRTNAQTLAGIIALWQRAKEGGAVVFGATLPAYTAATSQLLELNKSIIAAAREYGVVMGIPFYEMMIDPTFAGIRNKANYTQDEGTARLHPNNRASWDVARAAAAIIEPYTTPYSPLPVNNWDYVTNNPDSALISSNALLTGSAAASGTGVSGTWATGCGVNATTNGATTRVFSKATRADGYGDDLKMVVVTTGQEDNADVMLDNCTSRYVVGASYMAVARIKLTKGDGSPLDGTENCIGAVLKLRAGFTGSVNYYAHGMGVAGGVIVNAPEANTSEIVVKTPVIFTPSDLGAATILRASVAIQTTGATGAGGVMATISQCGVYRVA